MWGRDMPLEFLREISHGPLPSEVSGTAEIDKLRVLAAADMVVAELPQVGKSGPAIVRQITGYGRAALSAPARRELEGPQGRSGAGS